MNNITTKFVLYGTSDGGSMIEVSFECSNIISRTYNYSYPIEFRDYFRQDLDNFRKDVNIITTVVKEATE